MSWLPDCMAAWRTSAKRRLLSWLITPARARSIVASVVSWAVCRCIERGAWGTVTDTSKWLRRVADFVDEWNNTALPVDKERLIADLVAEAVTDDAVDRLVERITAMRLEQQAVVAKGEGGDAPVRQ